ECAPKGSDRGHPAVQVSAHICFSRLVHESRIHQSRVRGNTNAPWSPLPDERPRREALGDAKVCEESIADSPANSDAEELAATVSLVDVGHSAFPADGRPTLAPNAADLAMRAAHRLKHKVLSIPRYDAEALISYETEF